MLDSPFTEGAKVIMVYPNGYIKISSILSLYKNGNFTIEGDDHRQWRPQIRIFRLGEKRWQAQPSYPRADGGKFVRLLEPVATVYLDTPDQRKRLQMRLDDVYPGRSDENQGAA